MVILKRIKSSTLMETLIASVLIVIIFMLSSMILNNLFLNSIKNDDNQIESYLYELEYLYKNEKLKIPVYDDFESWQISIESELNEVLITAINSNSKKTITRKVYASP